VIRRLRAIGLACRPLASGAPGQSPGPAPATLQARCSLRMPMAGVRFCITKAGESVVRNMQTVDEQLQSLLPASEALSSRHRTVGTVSTVSTRHPAASALIA
jgi:hypothetical protein